MRNTYGFHLLIKQIPTEWIMCLLYFKLHSNTWIGKCSKMTRQEPALMESTINTFRTAANPGSLLMKTKFPCYCLYLLSSEVPKPHYNYHCSHFTSEEMEVKQVPHYRVRCGVRNGNDYRIYSESLSQTDISSQIRAAGLRPDVWPCLVHLRLKTLREILRHVGKTIH